MTKSKGAAGEGGGEEEELFDELLPASLFIIYSLFAAPMVCSTAAFWSLPRFPKTGDGAEEEEGEARSRVRMSLVFS